MSFQPLNATFSALYASPIPKPVKMVAALVAAPPSAACSRLAAGDAAARDSADAPAFSTSAHAVPSGYFKVPCCCTLSAQHGSHEQRQPGQFFELRFTRNVRLEARNRSAAGVGADESEIRCRHARSL